MKKGSPTGSCQRGGELRTQISLGDIAPVTRRREIFDG